MAGGLGAGEHGHDVLVQLRGLAGRAREHALARPRHQHAGTICSIALDHRELVLVTYENMKIINEVSNAVMSDNHHS